MKYIEAAQSEWAMPTIELTRRNLQTLLAKLDDPKSFRTIARDGIAVKAVEDDDHYSDRAPGEMFMPSDNSWA